MPISETGYYITIFSPDYERQTFL